MNLSKSSQVEVGLRERSYSIKIGRGLEPHIHDQKLDLLNRGEKVVAISDQGLRSSNPSFLNEFFQSTDHLILPSGEKTKSSDHLIQIWDFLANQRVDRVECDICSRRRCHWRFSWVCRGNFSSWCFLVSNPNHSSFNGR